MTGRRQDNARGEDDKQQDQQTEQHQKGFDTDEDHVENSAPDAACLVGLNLPDAIEGGIDFREHRDHDDHERQQASRSAQRGPRCHLIERTGHPLLQIV